MAMFSKWLRVLAGSPTSPRFARKVSLSLEALETRQLMAAGLSASLSQGILTVQTTPEADRIVLRPANQRIAIAGLPGSYARQKVKQIVVEEFESDDIVKIKSGGGQKIKAPIFVHWSDGMLQRRTPAGAWKMVHGAHTAPPPVHMWTSWNNGVLTINGTDGNDQVQVRDVGTTVIVRANAAEVGRFDTKAMKIDRIAFNGKNGIDYFRNDTPIGAEFYGAGVYVDRALGLLRIDGTHGHDIIQIGGIGTDVLVRFNGDMVAQFSTTEVALKQIRISGLGGNDELSNNLPVASTIYGGTGDDVLIGGSGNDDLYGGAGADRLFGAGGNDRLFAADGEALAQAQDTGRNQLDGGAGADTLWGSSADDILSGGAGRDTITDIFGGNNFAFGDQGFGWDHALFNAGRTGTELGVSIANALPSDGTDDGDTITLGRDNLVETNFLFGGGGDDVLDARTSSAPNYLYGMNGNDTLRGGSRPDFLFGGAGDDWLYGYGGVDYLNGQGGHDLVAERSSLVYDDRLEDMEGVVNANGQPGGPLWDIQGTNSVWFVTLPGQAFQVAGYRLFPENHDDHEISVNLSVRDQNGNFQQRGYWHSDVGTDFGLGSIVNNTDRLMVFQVTGWQKYVEYDPSMPWHAAHSVGVPADNGSYLVAFHAFDVVESHLAVRVS
jgi:Ca2+-binding RTX toxin-like protein